MKKGLFLLTLIAANFSLLAQSNDDCVNAEELCPNVTLSGTTYNANTTFAEDHGFCYVPSSTVWYKFTSNSSGGNVTVHFTNLVFDPDPTKGQKLQVIIYNVGTPCDQTTYTVQSGCAEDNVDFDITTAIACDPNTTYYVQVNGTTNGPGVITHADCTFDISVSGPGIDKPAPTVTITASDTDFCQGEDHVVDVSVTGCDDTIRFDWYYDGSLLYSSSVDTFSTVTLTDTGDLQVIVVCDPVCQYTDSSNIITFNVTPVEADAGPDKFIGNGQSVVLDGSGIGTPDWSPSSSLSDASTFTPTASPDDDQTYFLTVTSGPCTATDEVNVFVGEVIVIHGGFTPNGDGINDKWVIGNSSQFPNMEVNIYDRSGQRVFTATRYDTPDKWWDGTKNGDGKTKLPTSAYYYVIDLKEGTDNDIFKGMVTIIR